MNREWSIRRRLTLWISGSICALLVMGVGFTTWFVEDALKRELEALVIEELAELTFACAEQEIDPERFELLGHELEQDHPGLKLGWRAWIKGSDEPWSIGGTIPAFPLPRIETTGEEVTVLAGNGWRWRYKSIEVTLGTPSGPKPETLIVELLLDGSPREADLRRTGTLFLVIALAGSLVAILGGTLLARQLGLLLEQVARGAEAPDLNKELEANPFPNAPKEIRKVVDAIQTRVSDMRAEHSRNLLLTAGLAHELRSPMQNMITEAEVALLREREPHEYREVIGSLLEETQELAHVVDNLITLTALRDTEQLDRSECFDFGREADLRLEKERNVAARRGVSIELSSQGKLDIDGDREALLLMLRNLVGNAIQWTAPNSTVRVEIDGREKDLLIVVEDQGCGIPAEDRESVFEAFYQGQPPAGARMGYGLGLALAKAAVNSHGGEICLDDSARGGARFRVRLSRDQAA